MKLTDVRRKMRRGQLNPTLKIKKVTTLPFDIALEAIEQCFKTTERGRGISIKAIGAEAWVTLKAVWAVFEDRATREAGVLPMCIGDLQLLRIHKGVLTPEGVYNYPSGREEVELLQLFQLDADGWLWVMDGLKRSAYKVAVMP